MRSRTQSRVGPLAARPGPNPLLDVDALLDDPTTRVVVCCGSGGVGKTTVAALLADAWGVPARDTDTDVEAAEGREISEIFVDSGEAHFRALESAAVTDALAAHDGVLSLGGGAVLDPATRGPSARAGRAQAAATIESARAFWG